MNEEHNDTAQAGAPEWGSLDWAKTQPLIYRLNPCDLARFPALARLGDLVAKLAVECPCCNGFRMIFALAIGLAIGVAL